ncbi:MAG TPA: TM0106 family RecB-like putative nuclease [Propionibacteriaceae bacterium]
MTTSTEPSARTLLLGAYAARSCPVKTHNSYDPTITLDAAAELRPSGPWSDLLDSAARFKAVVLDAFTTAGRGRVVDLRLLAEESRSLQTESCVRAMTSGADVIIGGCLPADLDGHRVGLPDVLIRGEDTLAGGPGYHPVEVKGHKIVERSRRPVTEGEAPLSIAFSTLASPTPRDADRLEGFGLRFGSREADFVQLAHYYRMLAAAGFAAERALAAVIGTDGLWSHPVLVWADLDTPAVRTFSRSDPDGWRLRSPLERYDYEHAFRVDIARVAAQQSGHPGLDPEPLVEPIVNAECPRCPWWSHCRPQLHPDDVSLRIDKGALDLREIASLRRHGITTITDLARADLDALLLAYLPEVSHRGGAEVRLRTAVRRATMLIDGVAFSRETQGPITLAGAEVEIDFDIESSADGRIYLWGFLVRTGSGSPTYQEFSRFDDLDDRAEAALAHDAFTWLRSVIDTSPSVVVYHYSGYEVARIRELAQREDEELLDWAAAYAEEHFVDLLETVKTHYFGVAGLGLKLIATHAGFHWRDDDPGGLNSQRWFAEAVHADDPEARAQARTRVLEYNEDDVIATSHLRAWLRAQ